MLDKMKQLMEVKRQADHLKRELERTTLEVTEIQGIRVVISGAQKFLAVEIHESLLTPVHKSKLEKDLLAGLNAAINKAQNTAAQKMREMTGFNIPGM